MTPYTLIASQRVDQGRLLQCYIFNLRITRRAQVNIDPLTDILNRLGMQSWLRVQALDVPCAVVIIDVDKLMEINDQHGPDFGDRVLVKLADTLKRTTKDGHIVDRWGGEEFLIVLLDTSLESAAEWVEYSPGVRPAKLAEEGGGSGCWKTSSKTPAGAGV